MRMKKVFAPLMLAAVVVMDNVGHGFYGLKAEVYV